MEANRGVAISDVIKAGCAVLILGIIWCDEVGPRVVIMRNMSESAPLPESISPLPLPLKTGVGSILGNTVIDGFVWFLMNSNSSLHGIVLLSTAFDAVGSPEPVSFSESFPRNRPGVDILQRSKSSAVYRFSTTQKISMYLLHGYRHWMWDSE